MPPAARQQTESASLLLALPEQLLLEVLQRCDQRSLFSAARAHTSLRQAAAVALYGSIDARGLPQQQLDSMLLFLANHGHHISSLRLGVRWTRGQPLYGTAQLPWLPSQLALSSLQLHNLQLQLAPGPQCVLGSQSLSALKQLRLSKCSLPDGGNGLPAVLARLPGLEHLSLDSLWRGLDARGNTERLCFQTTALRGLQQLTSLQLSGVKVQGLSRTSAPLQPLRALTRLRDLRLHLASSVTARMLSGAAGLTRLELRQFTRLGPGLLAGQTQLQHLVLSFDKVPGGAAKLLSQLQPLQQLTHLCWWVSSTPLVANLPVEAFSVLTANSRLQHLDISQDRLPTGICQHLLPAGKQLPHLTSLAITSSRVRTSLVTPPEGSRLVSCCPGLQALDLTSMCCTVEQVAPLLGLSGLKTLLLGLAPEREEQVLAAACLLTGLQELHGCRRGPGCGRLPLPLAQMRHLTKLVYPFDGILLRGNCLVQGASHTFECKAPGDESVWRQVLRAHLKHRDPAVAQQAAAALAGAE